MATVSETREAILTSALAVFSHKGYVGATIDAIAQQAKVNKLTVFRHFQNKENLFTNVVMEFSDVQLDETALNQIVYGKTLVESLTALSRAYFEIMFRNIHIFRIFIIEARHFPWLREKAWRMPPALLTYLREFLANVLPDSPIKEDRLPLLTDMFLAHITRLTLQFNKHDSIWVFSEDLLNAFTLKMQPQIEFFANAMLADNLGKRISVRSKASTAKSKTHNKRKEPA